MKAVTSDGIFAQRRGEFKPANDIMMIKKPPTGITG